VWEDWIAGPAPPSLAEVTLDFTEVLECARLGAPRAFDLPSVSVRQDAYLRRALAREARLRGWVPIALDVLASVFAARPRFPVWLRDRSLAIFVDVPPATASATLALLRVAQSDARPHVLVRTLQRGQPGGFPFSTGAAAFVLHDSASSLDRPRDDGREPDAQVEASARWQWLVDQVARQEPSPEHALRLARVLVERGQPFEARALAQPVAIADSPMAVEAESLIANINERAIARAGKGWEMLNDFVDVLQLCQDTEDEQTALARVGAFVRERLQASSVRVWHSSFVKARRPACSPVSGRRRPPSISRCGRSKRVSPPRRLAPKGRWNRRVRCVTPPRSSAPSGVAGRPACRSLRNMPRRCSALPRRLPHPACGWPWHGCRLRHGSTRFRRWSATALRWARFARPSSVRPRHPFP
jgi:hypothetical protein